MIARNKARRDRQPRVRSEAASRRLGRLLRSREPQGRPRRTLTSRPVATLSGGSIAALSRPSTESASFAQAPCRWRRLRRRLGIVHLHARCTNESRDSGWGSARSDAGPAADRPSSCRRSRTSLALAIARRCSAVPAADGFAHCACQSRAPRARAQRTLSAHRPRAGRTALRAEATGNLALLLLLVAWRLLAPWLVLPADGFAGGDAGLAACYRLMLLPAADQRGVALAPCSMPSRASSRWRWRRCAYTLATLGLHVIGRFTRGREPSRGLRSAIC